MAYNNHFMFSTLTPTPQPPDQICSQSFLHTLDSSFSSFESLRETFIATASAMFGPGFTWLIKRNTDSPQRFSILNTYLAGSPFPGAHYRKQPIDMATTDQSLDVWQTEGQRLRAGYIGDFSAQQKTAPGGIELDVLMCVSTWEHSWLRDWGVGGKRNFLEAWWECIDWSTVEANGSKVTRPNQGMGKSFDIRG